MLLDSFRVPGVYSRPRHRAAGFPRVRTDVAGFAGVAGPSRLGEAVRVEDWKGYVEAFLRGPDGSAIEPPLGAQLASTVRDFFANGGRRCWIVNIARRIDPGRPQELLNEMLGLGDPDTVHGLELLLRQEEVSIVVLPELDATIVAEEPAYTGDPGPPDPCFRPCRAAQRGAIPGEQRPGPREVLGRLYRDDDLMWAQRYLINRLLQTRWRWFAILSPPPGRDPSQATAWRERLTQAMGNCDVAALYWPWLLTQDSPGAPVETRSPVGAVAGIFARVDLERGPHTAPANESLYGVVGLERPVPDEVNGDVYERGVNVLRAFPGIGSQVWGARTLLWQGRDSRGEPLAYVSARRCLSAIARTAEQLGQQMVFEPNTAMLRIRIHQTMTDYLLQVFERGALLGDEAEDAFFVRCDQPAADEGEVLCEIGVALAAPAEFVAFRLGRADGVIEIEEAA